MLEIIIFSILIATILNIFIKRFSIPTIIGYIATGTIIAYSFELHDAIHSKELKEIAEFGVVFLMFTIGLEFSVRNLMKMKKEVFLYGALQVIITVVFFASLAHLLFSIDLKSSIIIGSALALSSTAIVLKLLNENGDISKVYGRKVLGILLFQDIAVIPILLMITIFSVTDKSVSSLLLETLFNAAILLLGLFLTGKYLLEPFFHQVSKTKSNEIFVGSVLLVVMGASYLAHSFGFSYSLGAFIAGMMIAETHYKHQVEADLVPFRDLLLGVFFVTVGMQLDFGIIYQNISTILLVLPAVILIKIAIIFTLLKFATDSRIALKSAVSLFQLGEFGLVVFELSFAKNLIDPVLGQVLIVMVVISMILTPFVLKNISKIVDVFDYTTEESEQYSSLENEEKLTDHIVLIGYGRLGKNISKLLRKNNMKYVAIENDIESVKKARKQNRPVIFGNASQKSVLESVNIKKAHAVIISVGNSKKLHYICKSVNDLRENAKTIVKVNKYEEQESLKELNLSHIVVEMEKTANAMYEEAVKL
ncbi:cation:proton antiporter [Sulfurimonas sp.]|uniref:cation:proton antiporter n=1 Tax=Sulfurimonas sp. TaxID=2022749 RepID=UPI003562EDB1